jgi:hypothetical protein
MPMSCNPKITAQSAAGTVLASLLCFAAATAHGARKNINGPQEGTILYGQLDGQTTEAGAMGAMLRSLHSQYGGRPQVGKLFQVRGTQLWRRSSV